MLPSKLFFLHLILMAFNLDYLVKKQNNLQSGFTLLYIYEFAHIKLNLIKQEVTGVGVEIKTFCLPFW